MHDGAIIAPSRHLSVTESIALPPITKGNANAKSFRSIVFPWQSYSERPFCADCESPMILSRLEPDKPGFDLRTYTCLMCAATESIVVAVS